MVRISYTKRTEVISPEWGTVQHCAMPGTAHNSGRFLPLLRLHSGLSGIPSIRGHARARLRVVLRQGGALSAPYLVDAAVTIVVSLARGGQRCYLRARGTYSLPWTVHAASMPSPSVPSAWCLAPAHSLAPLRCHLLAVTAVALAAAGLASPHTCRRLEPL